MKAIIFLAFGAIFYFTPQLLTAQEIPGDTIRADSIHLSADPVLLYSDSVVAASERTIPDTLEEGPDPIKATLLSAALPGLGQAYNGSYWKIPLIYGGFFGFAAVVQFYNHNYIQIKNAHAALTDSDPATESPYPNLDAQRLFNARESNRRNRDYFMILSAAFYLLNVVEAHVDAHLQTFDIGDDLTLNINPTILQIPFSYQVGISLNLKFK